jgi:hypothetical protein
MNGYNYTGRSAKFDEPRLIGDEAQMKAFGVSNGFSRRGRGCSVLKVVSGRSVGCPVEEQTRRVP